MGWGGGRQTNITDGQSSKTKHIRARYDKAMGNYTDLEGSVTASAAFLLGQGVPGCLAA